MSDIQTPTVRLKPKISPRQIRFGAPWIFADQLVLDRRSRNIAPGAIVAVEDGNRQPLGYGAFNANSKIAVRMLGLGPVEDVDADWFEARFARAAALRDRLYDAPYYRLVHAEADGMPGLIVDRFGDAAVVQPNAAWTDSHLDALCAGLQKAVPVSTIVMNGSGRARKLEGLDERVDLLAGQLDGPLAVPMNGATYMADLIGGQKTGLFYDQRPNHAFAARLAGGQDVLDVFSHVGGFSLAALAAGAASATAVDGSASALELAEAGAKTSGTADRFTTRRGDAFAEMEALAAEDRQFGLVICDPPAFAPAKPALEAGLRAYERVARLGTGLVAPGGYLVLCSCSHAADLAKFREVSLKGVGRAGRRAQILHVGEAGPDHPVHPHLAESSYLKAVFLRLD
ncbi:RSP_2647 family RNA methyltransferase [Oceanomicrobium pacificus]|uniref:Methyltransferase domain-containing protein n=1 Tax=Oceanomicrobium pacificus TaxID=2692916 RepID=A0A6B0TNM9_9RHOB|nr:class I SAM-dependent rRNA methyltransferase [Oceanomicrobium pacificus]MXU65476.1 methyltransferase domain-containing protein [Oceanomicrobium pacificus]